MKIKVWGCRGSIPSPGVEKNTYGGNTSCVQVLSDKTCLILDGGSGIQNLGISLGKEITEIHLLLTHLHIDHIIGLGFFLPLYNPNVKVNIWGPAASRESLTQRLRRYFSPPIFPVRLNELRCQLAINEVSQSYFEIADFKISSDYVCHPGPTVAYRIEQNGKVLAYMPDHEPYLGSSHYPNYPEWTSGYAIGKDAHLLIHDGQYKPHQYPDRIGWGHSSTSDAIKFGNMVKAKKMLLFHHDPMHSDIHLNNLLEEALELKPDQLQLELAKEGMVLEI